jgi:hypothetical protein
MHPLELNAIDNLLTAKINQANQANKQHDMDFPYQVEDRVLISTKNHWQEYKLADTWRATKFMPCFDGLYAIIAMNPDKSTIMINLPNALHLFPVFHTSEVWPFKENDNQLFKECALHPPELVIINGEQEFFIEKIVDEHQKGQTIQYHIRWKGEGPEGDKWLPAWELEDWGLQSTRHMAWMKMVTQRANTTQKTNPTRTRKTAITIPNTNQDEPNGKAKEKWDKSTEDKCDYNTNPLKISIPPHIHLCQHKGAHPFV